MRKLSHKRALNQQIIDFFFKPMKEKVISKDAPNVCISSPDKSPIQNCFLDNDPNPPTKAVYEPIITYSDFELGFSTDDDQNQVYGTQNNKSRVNNKKMQDDSTSDNDSDFKKDEGSEENDYFNESQISSPMFITRHQELEKKNERMKVKIFTPTWSFTKSRKEPDDKCNCHFQYDFNSMCNIHYQLEVIEKRIQNGDDEEHEHPAMCVQVLSEEGLTEVTSEEKKLRAEYDQIECENIKPSFWEPRCYDDEYYQLTRNDNKLLQDVIYLANDADSDEIVTWEPEDDLIPPRHNNKNISNSYSPNKTTNSLTKRKEKKTKNSENYSITDFSKPSPQKFVFYSSIPDKVPQISFVYGEIGKNSKKMQKSPEMKKNKKKENNEKNLIESLFQQEKKDSTKNSPKKTLFSFVDKSNNEKPSQTKNNKKKNAFEQSDDDFSETDSTISDSELNSSSALDSTDGEDENDNESGNENENENEYDTINQIEVPVIKGKKTFSEQRCLRLSSLLFDTDSDGDTDLENF